MTLPAYMRELIDARAEIEQLRTDYGILKDDYDALRADNMRLRATSEKLGSWMSAALEDPQVCKKMKTDIEEWFVALEPKP